MRRLATLVGAAFLFVLGSVVVGPRLRRSWEARVAVVGHSMEPTLRDGDWLLVDPDAFSRRAPSAGELIVAPDPRTRGRILIKRVAALDADGRIVVSGDHPAHAADGTAIGPIASTAELGRPWFRYWPLERFGPISTESPRTPHG
jgi:hypothetical protein